MLNQCSNVQVETLLIKPKGGFLSEDHLFIKGTDQSITKQLKTSRIPNEVKVLVAVQFQLMRQNTIDTLLTMRARTSNSREQSPEGEL